MSSSTLGKRKPGCFMTGCLLLVLFPLVVLFFVFFLYRASGGLPERFALDLRLEGSLPEQVGAGSGIPFGQDDAPLSFQDLLFLLDRAAQDPRIEAVVLDIEGITASPAKISELRRAIEGFRSTDRQVIAFMRSGEDSDYLLASACDSIVVDPGGFLLLDGLRAETLYFGRTLEKLGIAFQASRWKEFKSGVEPFISGGPSKEYLLQVGALLDDAWDGYLNGVSRQRGINRDSLASWINTIALFSAKDAVRYHLVDHTDSAWRFRRSLECALTGKEADSSSDFFVGGDDYRKDGDGWPTDADTEERIALVSLAGTIVQKASADVLVGQDEADVPGLAASLEAALGDERVKAVVLRIDSPGGDALAAANMLEMLDSAAVRKPLVVSMSGLAASGGYMVALAGKRIYADSLTITGSIGVYALKPEISGLAEKIALGRSVLTRGAYADAMTIFKPLSPAAYRKFDEASKAVYDAFVAKVAVSRAMDLPAVESLARGRVWTGRAARENGLIDSNGGLLDALREAQRLGGIDSTKTPEIVMYPRQKSWLEVLMQEGLPGLFSRLEGAVAGRVAGEGLPLRQFGYGVIDAAALRSLHSGNPGLYAIMPADIVIR